MPSYSRVLLSGGPASTGRMIPVAATTSPGTLIHTAVDGASSFDEVHLWVTNVTGTAATLTIEWGGVIAFTDDLVASYVVPANSAPIPIATGQTLNAGLSIRAVSGTASALNISGYANRIS